MSDTTVETVIGLEDVGTLSADGFLTDDTGSGTVQSISAGEGSIMEPRQLGKNKRLNKRRRQRLQKKLSGLELGTISEAPCNSAAGTPKRARAASGNTPEVALKKQRTYAETVAQSTAKKFCVRENNNDVALDEDKLRVFKADLSRRILDAARSSGFIPQMLGCYLSDGVIMCKCSNEETFAWFCGEVSKINNLWSGCQLIVGDPPKPLLVHTWVPGPPENTSEATANIDVMNPNVSTSGWRVVRYKREANRLSIVYKVDLKSFEFIIGSGSSLQYVLEKIHFKVISGP